MAKPNKDVTWLKNGKFIAPGPKYEIESEGTCYMLTLPKCEITDAGEYTLRVDGQDTMTSAELTLDGWSKYVIENTV